VLELEREDETADYDKSGMLFIISHHDFLVVSVRFGEDVLLMDNSKEPVHGQVEDESYNNQNLLESTHEDAASEPKRYFYPGKQSND